MGEMSSSVVIDALIFWAIILHRHVLLHNGIWEDLWEKVDNHQVEALWNDMLLSEQQRAVDEDEIKTLLEGFLSSDLVDKHDNLKTHLSVRKVIHKVTMHEQEALVDFLDKEVQHSMDQRQNWNDDKAFWECDRYWREKVKLIRLKKAHLLQNHLENTEAQRAEFRKTPMWEAFKSGVTTAIEQRMSYMTKYDLDLDPTHRTVTGSRGSRETLSVDEHAKNSTERNSFYRFIKYKHNASLTKMFTVNRHSQDQIYNEHLKNWSWSSLVCNDGKDRGILWSLTGGHLEYINSAYVKPMGSDYYVYIFSIQFFALVFIFAWQISSHDFLAALQQDDISAEFIYLLMMNVVLIVLDRILYIRRMLVMKTIMHILLVLGGHFIIYYYDPILKLWEDSLFLLWYCMMAMYFFVSALQIRDGYPTYTLGQFLMKFPDWRTGIVYTIYRAIPFVFELKTVLDWTCVPTCLFFYEYFKLEDIYANLFLTQCDIVYRQDTLIKKGMPQPLQTKFFVGVLIFLGLFLVLFGPMMFFSGANPWLNRLNNNLATTVNIKISIDTLKETLYQSSQVTVLKSVDLSSMPLTYQNIAPETMVASNWESMVTRTKHLSSQYAQLYPVSDELWSLPPPSEALFVNNTLLDYDENPQWLIEIEFQRSGLTGTTSGSYGRPVTDDEREYISWMLNGTFVNDTVVKQVKLSPLLPIFWKIQNSGETHSSP